MKILYLKFRIYHKASDPVFLVRMTNPINVGRCLHQIRLVV